MGHFSKFFSMLFCGGLLYGSFAGAQRGDFIGSERSASVIADADAVCAPGVGKTADGRCRRSHRSYFYGSNRDGSYGHGK